MGDVFPVIISGLYHLAPLGASARMVPYVVTAPRPRNVHFAITRYEPETSYVFTNNMVANALWEMAKFEASEPSHLAEVAVIVKMNGFPIGTGGIRKGSVPPTVGGDQNETAASF